MTEEINTTEDSVKENAQDAAVPSEPETTEASPSTAEPSVEPVPTTPESTVPTPAGQVSTTDETVLVSPPLAPPKSEPLAEPATPISTPVPPKPPPAAAATEPAVTGLGIGLMAKLKEKLFEARQIKQQKMAANLEKIMAYALEKQKITNDEVERLTGVHDRQALKYLKILVGQGRLVRFGNKRNTFYKPSN